MHNAKTFVVASVTHSDIACDVLPSRRHFKAWHFGTLVPKGNIVPQVSRCGILTRDIMTLRRWRSIPHFSNLFRDSIPSERFKKDHW